MTTRQRNWREIGIAFETEPKKRTEKQKRLAWDGLCPAINYGYRVVQLAVNMGFRPYSYWWPTTGKAQWTRQCDYERAFFAYLMATISDNDYEEMIK